MTHDTKTPPLTIQTFTDQLNETLQSNQNADTLQRQTALLDHLFTTLMTTKIADRLDNPKDYCQDVTMEWLATTLKIQKQCMDTGKAAAAIDYMKSLNAMNTFPPILKIEKQTSETK